jgi:pimeloyl-ACP methyl ester carboxylesterase
LVLSEDSSFFVGGTYLKATDGTIMNGQMYVHAMKPNTVLHPYPVVMIHGFGQSGTNFEGTPDGREGWAQYFVRRGFAVYVVDQPARARSAYHSDIDGPTPRIFFSNTLGIAQQFTAPEAFNLFPEAHLHTQWPGTGRNKGQEGDPIFDQFFASQVESLPSAKSEVLMRSAGAALLDKIGPAILLTHSQGGSLGWQIADARPKLVKAILALEPSTPPTLPMNASSPAYGITTTPLTFSPMLGPADRLVPVDAVPPPAPLAACWKQADPVRALPNLRGIPIAIFVSEASPLTDRVHCVSEFLAQAGVVNELIRLPDEGMFGNGHMMMLEKNSDQIAQFLIDWLRRYSL